MNEDHESNWPGESETMKSSDIQERIEKTENAIHGAEEDVKLFLKGELGILKEWLASLSAMEAEIERLKSKGVK